MVLFEAIVKKLVIKMGENDNEKMSEREYRKWVLSREWNIYSEIKRERKKIKGKKEREGREKRKRR